jgi:DMSO reductase family type II enzyme heme b subunit
VQGLKVTDIAAYQNPAASQWTGVAHETVDMIPAPLGLQPNDYIIASWQNRPYGKIETVETACVHDGKSIAVLLRWACAKLSTGQAEGFPDAAAIAFPVRGDPILLNMGSDEAPIHALQWKSKGNEVRSVLAEGIGTSLPGPRVAEGGKGGWSAGHWGLVLWRSLDGPEGAARLAAGTPTRIGFAVWNGANEERAGIKAVSGDWTDLTLQP